MIEKFKNHPECGKGEVFVRNIAASNTMEFKKLETIQKVWSSARLGLRAYDEKNNLISDNRSVFVQFEELIFRKQSRLWRKQNG